MAKFLNKLTKDFSNNANPMGGHKPTFYSKIFENSLWFLKLKGKQLNALEGDSKPVSKHSLSLEEEKVVAPDTLEQAPIQKPKIPTQNTVEIEKEEVQAESLRVSTSFNKILSQINSSWKIDSIPGIDKFEGEVDIVFYGLDEIEDDEIPEFLPLSMIESDQDLMGRMIKAMKIPAGRFIRVPYLKKDAREFLFSCCAHFKPRFLIPLGAPATSLCLDKKIKMAKAHGEFFSVQIETEESGRIIEVMPLFHPNLLEHNVSMKKTAWADMKKVIDKLTS